MRPEDVLRDLVGIDTVKDRERQRMMDWISAFLGEYGFSSHCVGGSLVATRGIGAGIGFIGHTDTVSPSGDWQTDPWRLVRAGDRLVGLGACDMKGGIAAILMAAAQTVEPLEICFTYDEEVGFSGVKDLVVSGRPFPSTMIVGEPTDGIVQIAGKGLYEIRVEFVGNRVHSSTPDRGKNAIYGAATFVADLRAFGRELQGSTDTRFGEAPFTTFNVGQISGGDSVNTTAERCWLTVDFRTISAVSQRACEDFVAHEAAKLGAAIVILNEVVPFSSRPSGGLDAIAKGRYGAALYLTEASFLPQGCRRAILGPGPNTAHAANEFVSYDSLSRTIQDYVKLIQLHSQG